MPLHPDDLTTAIEEVQSGNVLTGLDFLLQQTLDEEGEADKALTALADRIINPDAEAEEEPPKKKPGKKKAKK